MDWQIIVTALIVGVALTFVVRRFAWPKRPKRSAIDVPASRLIRQARTKKNQPK